MRHVTDRAALRLVSEQLVAQDAFADGGLLVQEPAAVPLVMAQAVFAHGNLCAWHTNIRARQGANGGARSKPSVFLPEVRDHLVRLGRALRWHGALSLDAALTPDGPVYIDVNPRLVEPGNAWQAGTDLVEAPPEVTLAKRADWLPPPRADVLTHQLLIAVLGAGQHRATRRAFVSELLAAARRRGRYQDSHAELTPLRNDPLAAVPVVAAVSALVIAPSLWRLFAGNAISSYALTSAAWRVFSVTRRSARAIAPLRLTPSTS